MQVTLDLPDDVYADALAVAKQESRSLSSLVGDLIRGKVRSGPVKLIESVGSQAKRMESLNPFLRREFLPGVEKLMNTPLGGTPIDQMIDEDRSRE